MQHTAALAADIAGVLARGITITCLTDHLNCATVSNPLLANDVFWQNRSFFIGVGALGGGTLNQQNVVTLYNSFTSNAAASQSATGACPAASYWEIGVRGDTGPTNHATVALSPRYSVLSDAGDYPGANNLSSAPGVVSPYCNGSRIPPEFGGTGYQVPPGISDATVPNPFFSLTPAATVDEGNNWINLSWGPLSLTNPAGTTTLGNYSITAGSRRWILGLLQMHERRLLRDPSSARWRVRYRAVEVHMIPTLTSIAPASACAAPAFR